MLPDLTSLSLLSREANVCVPVPDGAVAKQVKSGELPKDALQKRGLIASAGAAKGPEKKKALVELYGKYRATRFWSAQGWLYVYWKETANLAEIVLALESNSIAFTLLGGAEVDPKDWVVANITKYWNSGPHKSRRNLKSALTPFVNDRDGTVTHELFEMIMNHPGMDHWTNYYNNVDAVLAAVRAGTPLRMKWFDDGMSIIDQYLDALDERYRRCSRGSWPTGPRSGR